MLSTPHFFQGSDYLVEAVEGLKPIKEEHETHFDLEPVRICSHKFVVMIYISFLKMINCYISGPVCASFCLQEDSTEPGRERVQSS